MKDIHVKCGNCGHEHVRGVRAYDDQNVPQYHTDDCECGCSKFVQFDERVPARETKAIWDATAFLNAQVPMATRIAVRQINELMKTESGESGLPVPVAQAATEFMSLMISQVTDIRGALIRDDSKFAHLVAHTDEIVTAMERVVGLAAKLGNVAASIEHVQERLDKIEQMLTFALDPEKITTDIVSGSEARSTFLTKTADLRNEPILIDGEDVDSAD